ncbi:MAG: hypothetical protein M3N54_10335 [Acidobacteriota bacterium]|nr:hypothetical protein [Acidobacteriota bacterium]
MPNWNYLASEVFRVRSVIAAHYLRGCRHVIEIGGYKTPIDQFLTHDCESVTVVDPLVEPFASGSVKRVAADYRAFDFSFAPAGEYGLVMLGFDLPLSDNLFRLVDGSRTTIIEFPEHPDWMQSRHSFDTLLENTHLTLQVKMHLDLAGNDYGDLTDSWPPRTDRYLFVFGRC